MTLRVCLLVLVARLEFLSWLQGPRVELRKALNCLQKKVSGGCHLDSISVARKSKTKLKDRKEESLFSLISHHLTHIS